MAESKSVTKRSVGRPKKNKALQQLRVQTWFNAVAEASGKTAYELEKEFAPSTVDRENFNKQRARLWEKYRLGKTVPTIKEKKGGRKGIAQLVEEKYPGTLKWLEHPIWTFANPDIEISTQDLRAAYVEIQRDLGTTLINQQTSSFFWRELSLEDSLKLIEHKKYVNFNDIFFMVSLIREAIISQRRELFEKVINNLKSKSIEQTIFMKELTLVRRFVLRVFV